MHFLRLVALLPFLLTPCLANAAGVALVDQGAARAVVLLPKVPDENEKLAARELIDHVEKMSGAKLETREIDPKDADAAVAEVIKAGKVPVSLGRVAYPRLEKAIRAKSDVSGTFA